MRSIYHIPTQHAQARFTFSVDGISEEMGFSIGFATPTDDAEEAASTLYNIMNLQIVGTGTNLCVGWKFTGVSVAENVGEEGPAVAENRAPVAGTIAQSSPPANCCILVRKNTAFGGRRNRGRLFMPAGFTPEGSVDQAGFLSAGSTTVWNANWEDFRVACVSADLVPVLFHQYVTHTDDGTPVPPPHPLPAPTLITAFNTQSQIATQRNRMR